MCSVYFPSKHETNIACWLFWCLVFLSVFLKICLSNTIWLLFDARLLVNGWQFWWKITLCQCLLFVSHCFAVRNLDEKREQLCFRAQYCILLRYLRVNETKLWRNIWFAPDFRLSLSKWFRKFKIYDMHKNISVN